VSERTVRHQIITFFFLDSKEHFSYAFFHKSKLETAYRFESSAKKTVGLWDSRDFGGSNAVRLNFACQRALLHKALDRMAEAMVCLP
jgi:bifunctional pyridoxal-dependent enzyme with beta-cystathionase and maltose regulon repressor activities